jgi:hypothetical protein
MSLNDMNWKNIESLRSMIAESKHPNIAVAAQAFVEAFVSTFPTIVLARMFLVLPFQALPDIERDFARTFAGRDARLASSTRVLALLGSAGHEATYQGRLRSMGHLAIPLLDRSFVQNIPMIAKLLADLDVDLVALDEGRPIATRQMLGGKNTTFFVPDAVSARDAQLRPIIPAREFVQSHGIRTVFGMGGSYFDGTLAVTVLFTQEDVSRATADRFASFISTFKTTTSSLLQRGAVYTAEGFLQ